MDLIRTWFIKGRGKVNDTTVISSQYFIKNNCISAGWGIDSVNNFYDYKTKWMEIPYVISERKKWGNQGIHHLFESVKKGDFVWTRLDGIYYVAVIPDDPVNLFYRDDSKEAREYDCQIQLRNINWVKVGTEEKVPGSVSAFTMNRNSLVKVDNQEVKYTIDSNHTLTSFISSTYLSSNNIKKEFSNRKLILNLLGSSGLEDIIALWLFDKYKYVVIPSTNKISTQKYEFVMFDGGNWPDYSNKRIYIQTKNGDNDLNVSDYLELIDNDNDEVWLVSRLGKIKLLDDSENIDTIIRISGKKYEITKYKIDEIVEFIFDERNKNIIPDFIKKCIDYFI